MPSLHPHPPNTSPPRREKWYSCHICGPAYKRIRLNYSAGKVGPTDAETLTGATSAATGVVVDSEVYTSTLTDVMSNGGFETAGTTYTFANWTDTKSGASTVNIETSDVHSGSQSCRLDIDASNNTVFASNIGMTLTASKATVVDLWYKNSAVGKAGQIRVRDFAGAISLQADGTWAAGGSYIELPNSLLWTYYSLSFTTHASYTSYTVEVTNATAPSSSIYYDDVSLKQYIDTGSVTLSGGTGVDSDTLDWGTEGESITGSVGGTGMMTMDNAWQYTTGILYPQSMIVERDGRYWCLEHYYAKFTPQDDDEIVMDLSDAENDIRSEDW